MTKFYQISEPDEQPSVSDELIVGIDLGTTNSLIAYHNGEKVEILATAESVVSYIKDSIVVGNDALTHPSHIKSIKRLIGKGIEDEMLKQGNWQVDKSSSNEMVRIKINKNKNVTPVEISSEILKHLKSEAEQKIKKTIKKAVITVPAHFDDAARTATRDAATIAGIDVVRMINEPTAAAIAYGLERNSDGVFLVYDLGGGTFDVSILKMQYGIIKVIATGGDNSLGGDDFDRILYNIICKKLSVKKHNINIDAVKKHLSENNSWKGILDGKEVFISRIEAEEGWNHLIDKTIKITCDVIAVAKIKDISHLILAGGATRIPAIQRAIKNKFKKKLLMNINPDEVVVIGAALQAKALQTNDHLLIDVVSLSLGIELLGGIVEPIIYRNTPIPVVVKKIYTTYKDGQTGLKIHIVQGEGTMIESCRSLGRMELTGLPKKPAGDVRIEITFRVDTDGLLSVTTQEMETGKHCDIEIKPSYGLTEDEVRKMIGEIGIV